MLVLGLVLLATPLQQSIGGNSQTSAVDLSSAKVVSLYESILDTDEQTLTRILADTGTEVVFRAYFQVAGPAGTNTQDSRLLRDRITHIKATLPWVNFMGGVDAYGYCGSQLPLNASEFLYVLPNGNMPKEAPNCWDLDIAKPAARKIVLDMAYTLIDAGFDLLFFDCLDCLAGTFNLPINPYMEAWRQIASAVKDYAQTKYGREIQVCVNTAWNADIWPYQDFISLGLTGTGAEMIRNQKLQIDWGTIKTNIKSVYGRLLPIMFFLDWGSYEESPMVALASLPREDQNKAITLLHDTALREGLLFVYPLHGGDIMTYAQIEQGLPWRVYDAIEQGTYDTIEQLTSTISIVHTMTVTSTETETSTETLTATVTANRTVAVHASPLVENPVLLISALVLGLAIVLAAIIMTRRKSSSCKSVRAP